MHLPRQNDFVVRYPVQQFPIRSAHVRAIVCGIICGAYEISFVGRVCVVEVESQKGIVGRVSVEEEVGSQPGWWGVICSWEAECEREDGEEDEEKHLELGLSGVSVGKVLGLILVAKRVALMMI